jgi:hypothetical protein
MRQHSNLAKDPAEKVVKDIRRATRKQYSAEEKIRTVAVERRDVVRRRGDFSGRSFGLPKYRAGATWCDAVVIFRGEVLASGPCAPGPCAGHCGRNTPCGGTRSGRGRFRGGKNERPFHMVWRLRAQPLLAGGANWTSLRAHRE